MIFTILLMIALGLTGVRGFSDQGITFFGMKIQGQAGKIVGSVCFGVVGLLLIWVLTTAMRYTQTP